jgi:hypothetical protein
VTCGFTIIGAWSTTADLPMITNETFRFLTNALSTVSN